MPATATRPGPSRVRPRRADGRRTRPGDEIGGFRLVKLIGRGAFGSVFEAEEVRGLESARGGQGAGGRACRRRALPQAIRRRDACPRGARAHPHVVPLYGAGEDRGCSLHRDAARRVRSSGAVAAGRPSRTALVAAVVGQVAAALDYAHSARLRPPRRQARERAGRAARRSPALLRDRFRHRLGARAGGLDDGRARRPRGTYAYMAPETIEARPSRDGRGDGYSLACVAHECLCGSAFFLRASEPATMMAQLKEPPPPLARELGLVPGSTPCSPGSWRRIRHAGFRLARSSPRRWRPSSGGRRGPHRRARGVVALAVGGCGRRWRDRSRGHPRWRWIERDAAAVGCARPRDGSRCAASAVASMTVADLNGDGREDVIVTRVERGVRRGALSRSCSTSAAGSSTRRRLWWPIARGGRPERGRRRRPHRRRSGRRAARRPRGPGGAVGGATLLVHQGDSIRLAARPPAGRIALRADDRPRSRSPTSMPMAGSTCSSTTPRGARHPSCGTAERTPTAARPSNSSTIASRPRSPVDPRITPLPRSWPDRAHRR